MQMQNTCRFILGFLHFFYGPRRDLGRTLEADEDRYITQTGEDASILYVMNCLCRECPIIFYLELLTGYRHDN